MTDTHQKPHQDKSRRKNGESAADSPSRSRVTNPRRRAPAPPRRLSETRGPEPATPLTNVRLSVGTVGGTHGLGGELKLHLLTDQPKHLTTIKHVYLGNSDSPMKLLKIRFHGGDALILLEGVTTPEQGRALGGLTVRIDGTDAKPLKDDEYFLFQLIDLTAFDESGDEIGTITDLIETGAHDVLVIKPKHGGQDILVPNHAEYVLATEPENGRMILRLPIYDNP